MHTIPFSYTTTTTKGDLFTQWQHRLSNGSLFVIELEDQDMVLYEVNLSQYREVLDTREEISAWLEDQRLVLEMPRTHRLNTD